MITVDGMNLIETFFCVYCLRMENEIIAASDPKYIMVVRFVCECASERGTAVSSLAAGSYEKILWNQWTRGESMQATHIAQLQQQFLAMFSLLLVF